MSQPFEIEIRRKAWRSAEGETVEVVRDLALALQPGSRTALVGPSGCGKTTVLGILLGLDSDFEGEIRGRPRRIGMVFQEPRLLPWRTVAANLALATRSTGAAPVRPALLEELGIADAVDRYPAELSLGMARRVALARALAVEPELLVLDEPFVSLDEATAGRMRDLVARVVARRAVTTLMVSHDPGDAMALCDRVAVLTPRPATLARLVDLPPLGERSGEALAALKARLAG